MADQNGDRYKLSSNAEAYFNSVNQRMTPQAERFWDEQRQQAQRQQQQQRTPQGKSRATGRRKSR